MKRNTNQNFIVIMLFSALLLIPLVYTDFLGGKVSNTENRKLSAFPVSVDSESRTIDVSRIGIESWISDNIGFRKNFVKIFTTIKNKVFGQSSSSRVLVGTGGWYFYTGDNNIEIATGNYPLNIDDLEKIAKYQQNISDYYHSVGKDYILMLTPSKVSVYSEYLPMADETVSYTPVDIVADYLREHTDVIIYNSKHNLLSAKSEGQLFLKTDTHWNELGSYHVYKGLFEIMRQQGIIIGEPVDVTFTTKEQKGEFSAMLGDTDLLPAETVPVAQWSSSFYAVTEGEQFAAAVEMENAKNPSIGCSVLKNDTVLNGKVLQIYGDSQLEIYRKIPCYLAESFSEVFTYAIRNVSTTVDEIADPDVVVFSCSERYIKDLLTVPADIPNKSDN